MVKLNMKKTAPKKRILAVRAAPRKAPRRTRQKENSNLLGNLGMAAGTFLGGPVGGSLGMAAGKLISKITGFGDYQVSKNSISMGNSVPTFQNGGDGVRICHREFLSDVSGSTGFAARSFSINPGLVASFPWLSAVAAQFEEYSLEGLVYEYRPSSGSAVSSTSSALGVVIMATDYDATNPPFSNKQQMESYEYSTSTVPFTGCLHPVECKRKLNVLGSQFVRTGSIPANADLRLFDVGNFQIATQGMQSVYTVGELWVSWDIVFRKPRISSTVLPLSFGRFRSNPIGTASSTNPMGTSGPFIQDNFVGSVVGIDATSAFVSLPSPGYYALIWNSNGAAQPVYNLGSNIIVGTTLWNAHTASLVSALQGSRQILLYNVVVTASGTDARNYVRIGSPAMVGATNDVDLMVVFLGPSPSLTLSSDEFREEKYAEDGVSVPQCGLKSVRMTASALSARRDAMEASVKELSVCTCDECGDEIRAIRSDLERLAEQDSDLSEEENSAEAELILALRRFRFNRSDSTKCPPSSAK